MSTNVSGMVLKSVNVSSSETIHIMPGGRIRSESTLQSHERAMDKNG
eukprot:CAMPEP_0184704346 /NCGR_PEP_ID=MMETSP0313-20130426/30880_1 /TAXON_ID=2792 /ORGANISM="Porphyridium aerugineum, Strain SAG 1380-2" /LENGTH=46 /DNA_ID= /DNA_START= /DNA_END= /DNA_ORIENTATION=